MRDRSIGPQIEGLAFLEHLGAGGYSDVYLYEQRKPRMRVAVKVLTDDRLSAAEVEQFAAEAETMAELADHPNIVQVFRTGHTDDGRPYLVMKYYPPPNLGQRAASERFAIAEVLRIGVQLAGAVETAHRAGVIHRDIKPANILVSQYGEPGLADFGIAGKPADGTSDEDLGVSIPWSPPEVLSGASNGTVTSDVYSLAATLWHLLAGRSPHEVPGGDNTARALVGRILRAVPPATGRADAPASLERLLQQSLAKQPSHRPGSALDLGRSLQAIEQELRYTRTEMAVEGVARAVDTGPRLPEQPQQPQQPQQTSFAPTESTTSADRFEPPTTLRPSQPAGPVQPPAPGRVVTETSPADPAAAPTDRRPARPPGPAVAQRPAPPGDAQMTVRRPGEEEPPQTLPQSDASGASTRRSRLYVVAASALIVTVVVIGVVLMSSGHRTPHEDTTRNGPVGTDQGGFSGGQPQQPAPPAVTATYDAATGMATFSWKAVTGDQATGTYEYAFSSGSAAPGSTTQTSVTVKANDPATTCITVKADLSNGQSVFDPSPTCAS